MPPGASKQAPQSSKETNERCLLPRIRVRAVFEFAYHEIFLLVDIYSLVINNHERHVVCQWTWSGEILDGTQHRKQHGIG